MSSSYPLAWKNISVFVVVGLFALGYVAQIRFDAWQFYSPSRINTTYNVYIEPQPLSSQTAKLASLGATEFMADYYWLTLIQYYGGGTPNGKYRKLAELFNTVTDLSPKFATAYQNGLLILPGEGFVDQAIALGKKGQQNLPDSWEMPYYTGLVYHIYKKDYVSAAKEFQKAADLPGAPPITKLFVAIYYNQADQRQIAYGIFKTIYDTTDDTYIKDRAAKYVGHLEMLFSLQDAVTTFHQKFGRNPKSLNELVDKKIISEIPVSPLGRNFVLDPKSGQVNDPVKS